MKSFLFSLCVLLVFVCVSFYIKSLLMFCACIVAIMFLFTFFIFETLEKKNKKKC